MPIRRGSLVGIRDLARPFATAPAYRVQRSPAGLAHGPTSAHVAPNG